MCTTVCHVHSTARSRGGYGNIVHGTMRSMKVWQRCTGTVYHVHSATVGRGEGIYDSDVTCASHPVYTHLAGSVSVAFARDIFTMGPKRKCVSLSVAEKLKVIQKLESGISVANICLEYGIAKQTVSDIKRSKEKLKLFVFKCDAGKSVSSRKRLTKPVHANVDEAVHKWYIQQRSSGVAVRGVEIKAAAEKLAKHMNVTFKASDGWLFRFRHRHGIVNRRMYGESLSADTTSVEPFRKKINTLLEEESITRAQLYNADETGLFWRSLPENTQAYKHDSTTPGRKLCKDRLSALLCANVDGSHSLKSVVVGKSRRPRVLKDTMNNLPVHYYNSKNAWFTQEITDDWFQKHFVPEVRRFQMDVLKIPADDVKALLLVDNAPSHPQSQKLCSPDGKIKCMALPPNTTSLIQPMDQGIILACKRKYKKLYLDEVMVVLEEPEDAVQDTRGKRTLQRIRDYNIKSAIFNWASSWKQMKTSTLINGWKKLLFDEDVEPDFKGFEAKDFQETLAAGGETNVTEADIYDWLEADEGDPGCQILTEEEIACDVASSFTADDDTDEEELEPLSRPKLASARDALDTLINIIDSTADAELQPYYQHFRSAREIVIRKQHQKSTQLKIDSFFKVAPSSAAKTLAVVQDMQTPSCSFSRESVCFSDSESD